MKAFRIELFFRKDHTMKKFLALMLALLTVVGLSSAAFAATVSKVSGNIPDNLKPFTTYAVDPSDVLRAIGSYQPGTVYNDLYTSWVAYCPEDDCDGVAFFYIDGGKVYWVCPVCGSSGVISGGSSSNPDKTYTATVCSTCGKADQLLYLEDGIKDGKYCEIYYCSRCQRLVYVDAKPSYSEYGLKDHMNCLTKSCSKTAYFKDFVLDGEKLYARYECSAGHVNSILVENDYYYGGYHTRGYTIRIAAGTGGEAVLDGSSTARWGETRTVTFYPNSGYALASVTINGVEVKVTNNKVTFYVEDDTVVRASFVKAASLKDYTIKTTISGNGSVDIAKNGKHLNYSAAVTAKNADTVICNFIPGSGNYAVADVKIDGRSKGAVSSYTFSGLTADHTVEVTFAWKNPYADVETKYLSAVEYVTEGGIMGPYTKTNGKYYFSGRTGITVGDLVNALAELCDTAGKLNSDEDRRAWAVNYGIISKKTELSANCDVQQACTIIKNYLEVLEDLNKVTFTKLVRKGTVRENAISLNLATAKTFDGNRNLHRYDLAAICRLIARLDYKG